MTRFRVVVMMMLVLGLVALAFPSRMNGQTWNKRTKVTFSGPVEIPGVGAQVLPAGTYYFRLLDSTSDRHIVQIFNEREDHVYCNHPCDTELPFAAHLQDGHDVPGKSSR